MSHAFLQLRNVTKHFGKTEALRQVSFDVHRDELLVVLGPTGAGEDNVMRTIAGLETPDAGAVTMDGSDMTHASPAARDVALVFQNFSLYPDRTVRKNLEFPLRAPGRKMTQAQIDDRVYWAAGILKVTHLLDRPATRLSGGEMQRVAIGRAIVRRPRLFLMDEPLTNLDAKLREALRVELVMLRRELKTPMVFVTHDQAEAMSMADRIVVLSEGRILQTGTPEQIYRQPASVEVARQLGQPAINLIPADRLPVAATPASPLAGPLRGDAGVAATRGAECVGVRPEDIAVTGGSSEAIVKVVENMGPMQVLLVDWLGQEVRILAEKSQRVAPGDRIFPSVAPARIIVW